MQLMLELTPPARLACEWGLGEGGMDSRDYAIVSIGLAVIALGLVEIALLIAVAGIVGTWTVLGLLSGALILGFFTMRWLGIGAIRSVLEAIDSRRLAKDVAPQASILAAALLFIFPGLLSDAMGLALLLLGLTWTFRRARYLRHSLIA